MALPVTPRLGRFARTGFAATLTLAACATAAGAGQGPDGPKRPSPKAQAAPAVTTADDRIFAEAARAVASGETDSLLASTEAALLRAPGDRTAAARRAATLLAMNDAPAALRVYAAWAEVAGREDAALLARVAAGMLRQLEQASLAEIRARAREARARHGDAGARKALEDAASAGTAESWEATLALARLGDGSAVDVVAASVREAAGSRKVSALAALRGLPDRPSVVEAIRGALGEKDDMVRDAAAEAATGRNAPSLVGPLREVVKSARFTAPLRAAVALMRMGDVTGRHLVETGLEDPLPDGRILAARAYLGRTDTTWAAKLEPVLADPNQLLRIFAAEVLLPVRPGPARLALDPLLTDANPALRTEAVRVAATDPVVPLAKLRVALADAAPWVRLHAAEALARPLRGAP
jgi:hypothetical protein